MNQTSRLLNMKKSAFYYAWIYCNLRLNCSEKKKKIKIPTLVAYLQFSDYIHKQRCSLQVKPNI